ncbi:phospho-sugar mutase [Ruminococcus flavefaciens]|uniref:phospho-sugar mutase n=1 Tax=Ruminococcus flavefaciens TaxID=1265 RepID=UPI00196810BF|nr:phospho-sugar mutase [Ruminococcus flavefaciens]
MSEMELYSLWCENAKEDPDLKAELEGIKGDSEAINDRFYRDLEFGTGGLRGVIGAGTNRMNIYTVRRATQGFADYLNQEYKNPSVAISYDSRIKSDVFSKAAAEVLAANGIKVHIYKQLMPTPCLSWAVRALKCQGGIMVTASHNPAKYNGYKVYGEDGCQITLRGAEIILEKINSLDMFSGVKHSDFDKELAAGNISYIDDSVIEEFYTRVLAEGINTDLCASSGLKVVYTPLNGTGNKPVREILKRIGITDVTVVKEQENPDGNFTTCPYPNPEIREALQVGLSYCDKVKPDLLLATDPDCDRVGIAVPDGKGGYALFSGNEVGAMLLEYICSQRIKKGTMPKNPITVKTIVTTDIVNLIAKEYGVEVIDVLTGFKFIGEQIGFLEAKGEENRYIFGFEESYGYLSGGYVRDKDAVDASMLICEMAAYYRTQGITLIQARENMYKKYGMFLQTLYSFEFDGESGMKHMEEIMTGLRSSHPTVIGGLKVERFEDYKASTSKNIATGEVKELTLPKSNVLAFYLENGCKAIVRPSGTEPKIKTYITAKAASKAEAEVIEQKIYADFTQSMK